MATTTNGFTNWSAMVPAFLSGANVADAFAVDAVGNSSLTNTVKFTYAVASISDWLSGYHLGIPTWKRLSRSLTPALSSEPLPTCHPNKPAARRQELPATSFH